MRRRKKEILLLAAMALFQVGWLAWMRMAGATFHWKPLLLLVALSAAGAGMAFVPERFTSWAGQLEKRSPAERKIVTVLFCLGVWAAGIAYAGCRATDTDEMLLMGASGVVAEKGASFFLAHYEQFRWLSERHPPLVPLVMGEVFHFLGPSRWMARSLSWLLAVILMILTYRLARRLYDSATALRAALVLLTFPYFVRAGAIALTDMPVAFFFTLSMLFALRLMDTPRIGRAVALGISLGLGLLTKYTMAFFYPVLGAFSLLRARVSKQPWGHLAAVLLVSLGILGSWLFYLDRLGLWALQQKQIFFLLGNVLSMQDSVLFLLKYVPTDGASAFGAYNVPLILLGVWSLSSGGQPSDQLVLVWGVPMALTILLTSPDPRYFLPIFPALAIAIVRGLQHLRVGSGRPILLGLLYSGAASVLSVLLHPVPRAFQ